MGLEVKNTEIGLALAVRPEQHSGEVGMKKARLAALVIAC